MSKNKHKKDRHDGEEASSDQAESAACSTEELEALIAERDDFRAKYQRALADYQNAQRRSTVEMAAAREAGVERVLASLMPVLDHFDLALGQDPDKVAAEQILAGVRMIRDEFSRAMSAFGVVTISPAPNEEFDPSRHEALSQLAAEGVEPGRVSSVYQVGYRVGERVVRPAKVTIAPEREIDGDDSRVKVI